MYDASRLRGFGALADGPLPHLVSAGGEEAAEVHALSHGGDYFRQGALGAQLLALFVGLGFAFEPREAFFEGDGYRNYWVAFGIGFEPGHHFREMLVFLPYEVLFGKVD